MLATQKVAKKLDKAFPDVSRTGMFFEGFGVDHVHSKLSPMHGTGDLTHWKPIESRQNKFFEQYEGYLSSHDHERADDEKLAALAAEFVRHKYGALLPDGVRPGSICGPDKHSAIRQNNRWIAASPYPA